MEHYLKIILFGLTVLVGYFFVLFSSFIEDKFSLMIIGLFVVPLGVALVTIGLIERHYKK